MTFYQIFTGDNKITSHQVRGKVSTVVGMNNVMYIKGYQVHLIRNWGGIKRNIGFLLNANVLAMLAVLTKKTEETV